MLRKVFDVVYSKRRMNIPSLLRTTQCTLTLHRNLNCWTAGITKKHRKLYLRDYPTYLVLPDGSSINITYDVPRKIIRLPLNLDSVSEEVRRARLQARKPIEKIKIIEEYQDDFSPIGFYSKPKDTK